MPKLLKLAARDVSQLWTFGALGLACGLLILVTSHSAFNEYDDPSAARQLFFLMGFVVMLGLGCFIQGSVTAASSEALAAGMTRRNLFKLHAWQSCLYALGIAVLTLMVVIVMMTIRSDFSGELVFKDNPRGNLWVLPIVVALGCLQLSWWGFALSTFIKRLPWYFALAMVAAALIIPALVLLPFDMSSAFSPSANESDTAELLIARFLPFILILGHKAYLLIVLNTLVILASTMSLSWLCLRYMPHRK